MVSDLSYKQESISMYIEYLQGKLWKRKDSTDIKCLKLSMTKKNYKRIEIAK